MKKFFLFMACAMSLILASCGKKVEQPVIEKGFNEVLNEEYKSIKDTAPNVVFYESQVIVDTTISDKFGIKEFMNIYQNGKVCIQIVHKKDSIIVNHINDYWLEDVRFDPDTLNLSIEGAYERYLEANIAKPAVLKFVTLRCPLGPTLINPQYYFGQGKVFVAVDAITGDVTEAKR